MMDWQSTCPPVLSCDATRELERRLFASDEMREWNAMQAAGRAIARAVQQDAKEIGGLPADARVLVLAGKGHNGGDALIAAEALLEAYPSASATVVFGFGERSLRPLAARAWRELVQRCGRRVAVRSASRLAELGACDVCLDGIFGFQFRPPLDSRTEALIERVNQLPIRLRAAVDLPSADRFAADFTYATGCVKDMALASARAGRLRYLDLGFFDQDSPDGSEDRVLTPQVLAPLRLLRAARSDKRQYGHVFLLGGSRSYPGAIFMSVEAAVRSGAGLVTAFVPESFAAAYAARLPEAMWVGWPETPAGGLALEGEHLWHERCQRADALVVGPGLGREPETLALAASLVRQSGVPVVIDADALQPDVVAAGNGRRVATPHAGEYERIAGGRDLRTFSRESGVVTVLKGPVTRVTAGAEVYHSLFGGPVLARGGSGDVLAGMLGTQLAQSPDDPLGAAARAVAWHGLAADCLARARGQVAVRATELLDFLTPALQPPAA